MDQDAATQPLPQPVASQYSEEQILQLNSQRGTEGVWRLLRAGVKTNTTRVVQGEHSADVYHMSPNWVWEGPIPEDYDRQIEVKRQKAVAAEAGNKDAGAAVAANQRAIDAEAKVEMLSEQLAKLTEAVAALSAPAVGDNVQTPPETPEDADNKKGKGKE